MLSPTKLHQFTEIHMEKIKESLRKQDLSIYFLQLSDTRERSIESIPSSEENDEGTACESAGGALKEEGGETHGDDNGEI